MRVPRKARGSNQSILKEINPENSLEGLMLKLKLQCFGHLTQRAYSLEMILMLGKRVTEDEMVGWHHMLYSDFLNFYLMYFSCVRIPSRTPHCKI